MIALVPIAAAFLAAAAILPVAPRRHTRWAALAPAAIAAWAVAHLPAAIRGEVETLSLRWLEPLGVGASLRLDGLAVLMVLLVGGVGVAVVAHAARYAGDAYRGRLLALLLLFAVAMTGLVLADDLILLYLFWEATSILSFLLIGTKDGDAAARTAARRALAITAGGGLVLLTGLVVLAQAAGTTQLSALLAAPPSGTAAEVGLVLVLIGAATKAAQVPFHSWLPGAMAAPAPVSAYLHSATMVKAGVYLVARFAPLGAAHTGWTVLLTVLAGTSVLYGGWQALRSDDLKRLLAYSTISQLGLILLVLGTGSGKGLLAGVALIVAHAVAKAALFLLTGTLETVTGTRSLSALSGVGRAAPRLGATAVLALASLAGVPPLAGFVAKEAGLVALLGGGSPLVVVIVTAGSALTAAYALRMARTMLAASPERAPAVSSRARGALTVAPLLLAAGAVVLGLGVAAFDRLAGAAAAAVEASAADAHLALWAGFNTALLLSVVALLLGAGLAHLVDRHPAAARVLVPAVPFRSRPHPVDRLLDLPALLGRIMTTMLRPGSLPAVVVVLVAVLAVLVVPPLVETASGARPPLLGDLAQSAALVGVVAGAVAAATVRHRFGAVLGLGVVGFSLSGWFLLRGAPDLALTQVLVETVVVLAFLLLLKQMPTQTVAEVRRRRRRGVRVAAALAAGMTAVAVGLAVTTVAPPTALQDQIAARALPDGKGRNIVNVILTDIRALDTLAEITVVAVAALGVVSLLRSSITGGRRDAA